MLEELGVVAEKIWLQGKETRLVDQIDLFMACSWAARCWLCISLYGADTIPSFEQRFLKQISAKWPSKCFRLPTCRA